jgi:hypothetical protein
VAPASPGIASTAIGVTVEAPNRLSSRIQTYSGLAETLHFEVALRFWAGMAVRPKFGVSLRIGNNQLSRIMVRALVKAALVGGYLPWNWGVRNLAVFSGLVLLMGAHRLAGQQNPLSPTEAYKTALAPYTETRSQANDLTDADKIALGIGMAEASRDCLALSSNLSAFAGNANELFSLGQLCIFGQQFEPARAALVEYLALPQPPKREQALLLLVRAFLGLKEPESAEAQVDSLMRDYPYDASIHAAVDQVIDSAEGASAYLSSLALKLCAAQGGATLPLLRAGKALQGENSGASAATLFADAVRCAALADGSAKTNSVEDLAAIVQEPNWVGTADLGPMQAALARQQMVGKSAPLASLRGNALLANSLVPRIVPLRRGTVLLVPFTLWSPSTPEIAGNLARFMPQQTIYAVTSWHANTGREDVQSSQVLEGLRSWQRNLPRKGMILIVPDSVLSEFYSDVFPVGILIRDGTVLSNSVLSSEGAERLLVNAFGQKDAAH